jgi:hypothetical protein
MYTKQLNLNPYENKTVIFRYFNPSVICFLS